MATWKAVNTEELERNLVAIGNALREMYKGEDTYALNEMANAILNMPVGGDVDGVLRGFIDGEY